VRVLACSGVDSKLLPVVRFYSGTRVRVPVHVQWCGLLPADIFELELELELELVCAVVWVGSGV
jgi:hypothetical protein